MAYNNTVTLTGNTGIEARIIETDEQRFAAVTIATTDSYQDKDGNWQDKETVWHNILAFSPKVIEELKALKTGTRIKVTGSLAYRPFEVVNGDGELITKKEASIIAGKVELAALPKKPAKPEAA
jgi:single-stranded DNA-binding protein